MISIPKVIPFIFNTFIVVSSILYGYRMYTSASSDHIFSEGAENIDEQTKLGFISNIMIAVFISFILNSDILKIGMI